MTARDRKVYIVTYRFWECSRNESQLSKLHTSGPRSVRKSEMFRYLISQKNTRIPMKEYVIAHATIEISVLPFGQLTFYCAIGGKCNVTYS